MMRQRATAVVVRNGAVLLVRDRGHRKFSLPGGGIHRGEAVADAANMARGQLLAVALDGNGDGTGGYILRDDASAVASWTYAFGGKDGEKIVDDAGENISGGELNELLRRHTAGVALELAAALVAVGGHPGLG